MGRVREVDDDCLRRWPLPQPSAGGDKEERGHVMIVAGSREMPGAAWLAAMASLRAGAGKLVVGTAASVAPSLATNLPEARVLGLPEASDGGLSEAGVELLEDLLGSVNAVLLGPGWIGEKHGIEFSRRLIDRCPPNVAIVLDALAMATATENPLDRLTLLTPHAGEMAHLLDASKEAIVAEPQRCAVEAARGWRCVVALKGPTTIVATPDGDVWRHEAFEPGLGTSGSGDALAGVVTGLVARGASLEQAAVWGVALHARAGRALSEKLAPLGYLASELLLEVPKAMQRLGPGLAARGPG